LPIYPRESLSCPYKGGEGGKRGIFIKRLRQKKSIETRSFLRESWERGRGEKKKNSSRPKESKKTETRKSIAAAKQRVPSLGEREKKKPPDWFPPWRKRRNGWKEREKKGHKLRT